MVKTDTLKARVSWYCQRCKCTSMASGRGHPIDLDSGSAHNISPRPHDISWRSSACDNPQQKCQSSVFNYELFSLLPTELSVTPKTQWASWSLLRHAIVIFAKWNKTKIQIAHASCIQIRNLPRHLLSVKVAKCTPLISVFAIMAESAHRGRKLTVNCPVLRDLGIDVEYLL